MGEGGDSSGLLQAALSDSWPRREDWQGRDFIVDRRGGGGEGGRLQSCGNSCNGEGVERTQLSPPASAGVRIDTPNLPHPQRNGASTMETIIYLNNLCLL